MSDDFAAGISLHGIYTSESFVFDSSSITSAQGGGAIQSSLGAGGTARAFDLAAILGAAYHVGPVTLGASVQLPTLHVLGTYDGALHSEYGISGSDTATLTSGSGSFSAQNAVTTGDPELVPGSRSPPSASPPGPRELPRSGGSDPRNGHDPDTGRAATKSPSAPDGGSPPQDTPALPGAPIDPQNRSFPPR